jgi:hypothetical protein
LSKYSPADTELAERRSIELAPFVRGLYSRQSPRPESVLAPLRPPARKGQCDHQVVMPSTTLRAHPHPATARRCHPHIRKFSYERTGLFHGAARREDRPHRDRRVQEGKEAKSQGSTGRVASDSDLFEAALDESQARRPNVLKRGREWTLRCEPVVGHKCWYTCPGWDMARQMPESVSRAPVEPSAVNMQDGRPLLGSTIALMATMAAVSRVLIGWKRDLLWIMSLFC